MEALPHSLVDREFKESNTMNGWMVKGSLGKIDGDKLADEVRGLFGRDNRTHAVLAAFRTALGSVPRNGLIGKRHKINRATLNRLKLHN